MKHIKDASDVKAVASVIFLMMSLSSLGISLEEAARSDAQVYAVLVKREPVAEARKHMAEASKSLLSACSVLLSQ